MIVWPQVLTCFHICESASQAQVLIELIIHMCVLSSPITRSLGSRWRQANGILRASQVKEREKRPRGYRVWYWERTVDRIDCGEPRTNHALDLWDVRASNLHYVLLSAEIKQLKRVGLVWLFFVRGDILEFWAHRSRIIGSVVMSHQVQQEWSCSREQAARIKQVVDGLSVSASMHSANSQNILHPENCKNYCGVSSTWNISNGDFTRKDLVGAALHFSPSRMCQEGRNAISKHPN